MIKILYFILTISFVWCCTSPEKEITIYTIGDSTMADKKQEVYPETGWGQVFSEYFNENVTIENHAVNGRSSKSFIDEGRWETVLDSLNEGDYVFIQFGHNDEKQYDSTRYTTPYGTYPENLEKFVTESREKGAKPVLFTSIVRRKFDETGNLKSTHGDYPEAVRKVAERLDVPLIDLQQITKEWVNSLGDESSKEMYLWTGPDENFPEGKKDDTHLSEEGAKKVAQLALAESKRKNLAFTRHLK